MGFNYIRKLANKAYKRGNHLAKKSRHFVIHGARKARDIIHTSQKGLKAIGKIAKTAAPYVAEVASLLPGTAGNIAKGVAIGINGYNTVSSFLDRSSEKARQTEDFATRPTPEGFRDLFS